MWATRREKGVELRTRVKVRCDTGNGRKQQRGRVWGNGHVHTDEDLPAAQRGSARGSSIRKGRAVKVISTPRLFMEQCY